MTPEDQMNSDGSAINPWRLCSKQKVEELKCLLRVIPIWASGVEYYVASIQQQTYVVYQALQSDSSFKIPAASYTVKHGYFKPSRIVIVSVSNSPIREYTRIQIRICLSIDF
ncbi:hypothetical protein ACOSQ2_024663 [Xanthoceras sorbifolium]